MSLLTSRPSPRRVTPRIEALEERSLLDATFVGNVIKTTGAVNHVLITDNGTTVSVFSDHGFLGSRPERTPLTLTAGKAGSTNDVAYDLLGSTDSNAANATGIVSSLTVNFGTGKGQLLTKVVAALPTDIDTPIAVSNLGAGSNVHVTANSSRGNIEATVFCNSLATGAAVNVSDVARGGADSFSAFLGVPLAG
jgi:uncharacterized protein YaiE (UPF0345 family)